MRTQEAKPAVGTEAVTQGGCEPGEPRTWHPLLESQHRQTRGQAPVAGREVLGAGSPAGSAAGRAGGGPPSSGDRPWPSALSAP